MRYYEQKYTIIYSIAVQKWKNEYQVYTSQFDLDKSISYYDNTDERGKETIYKFHTVEEVVIYFRQELKFNIEKLHILRGQKIFTPL